MAIADLDLIAIRRHLHAYPELSMAEFKTQAYLKEIILSWQSSWLTIREIPAVPTALLVRLTGSKPTRTIGYRADIDALPINEETDLAYASKNPGVMHACGHDIHMTVALGVLAYFATHQPVDNLIFLFQPAEEEQAGGKQLYELGTFVNEWRPDEFYALHDQPAMPAGQIATRQGTLFAGTTEIHLTIKGRGGHAAFPHQAQDVIVAASSFVMALQTIVSRNVNPVRGGVITIGKLQAGTIGNVIPNEAKLAGTIRAFEQADLEMMQQRVREIAQSTAAMYSVTFDLELNQGGYWPVNNDSKTTTNFMQFMQEDKEIDFVVSQPAMTGEDFGYLINQIPGTMFWLGVGDAEHGLHDSHLAPDESAIEPGIRAITKFLNWRMQQ
ncbi:N-acetyldiaminopimelate deacetylase [Weissella sagaensis]|uniref:N-acetyldiaminopimelate deacetylase n=1 Tax=Weissella sagaensis TaxID=2559928 RepID=A0ABW1RRW7_9LACO|nr:N-acetyldiaminopimelate deacetylase [Weissella sagaensis]QDJ58561.1 amidohydrolase [Weissella hellenica]QEA57502.1 N-acetyldiaminopimelate deacetylase [Weissella hellenica]